MFVPKKDILTYIENNEIAPSNYTESTTNIHSIIDENGCYKFISDSVVGFLGYTVSELSGKKACNFIHKQDARLFVNGLKNLQNNKTITLPLIKLCCKNGGFKLVEISITNLLKANSVNGFLANYRDISDIIQAVQIKEHIVSSHASFFAKHPFGIFHMTIDGIIDRINPTLMEDLGYELADLQKRPTMSFILPLYRRKAFLMFYNAVNRLEPETYDVEVYTSNGVPLHVNFTIIPVVYENHAIEIYGVVKDISDRFELQESLRRTSIVADKSLNGVLIMDCNRKIEWVNKGFTLMNGYTLQESFGKDPSCLLKVDGFSQETIGNVKEMLSQGKTIKKELLCYKKDDSTYWNLVEITPVLNRNGKLDRIISIHTDITAKKQAEDDLKRFAADLYRQNKELHQFAYIVSHNLRSPVANIVGLASMLDLYKDDAETLNSGLVEMLTAANNMDTVIKDLSNILEISNSSTRGLTKEVIDIAELMEQIQIDLKNMINHSSALIVIPDKGFFIKTNKAYLYSILYNLVNNAIKYSADRRPEIIITCQCHINQIGFSVADNGTGIDMLKHSESIFKPYHRINSNVEGKGLGLFLVKSHVEALGGAIEVESELGKGTTFRFVLPS